MHDGLALDVRNNEPPRRTTACPVVLRISPAGKVVLQLLPMQAMVPPTPMSLRGFPVEGNRLPPLHRIST